MEVAKLQQRKSSFTITIPAKFARELGWQKGDIIGMERHGDEVRIAKLNMAIKQGLWLKK